ncbi:hypothetical protein KP79_PYT04685 [Mizuhopecten yessoensis]|uniref:Uncharacterized protein n=1 Tax=Mizuhopecten yessoensis TaxID=6573 RepID=A0A210PLW5_MIZYE|nr:hypothetical protein KP79_PYT04685 [Mizuhopecten yessoensis]
MPSASMMSARNLPPPLPARKNLPPVRKGVPVSRAVSSAVGRPLPATPPAASPQKNMQALPNRNKKSPVINYENHELGMSKIKSLPAGLSNLNEETPPPPPPGRPPKRSMSVQGSMTPTRSTSKPTAGLALPPALPSRGPPRRPSTSSPGNDTFHDLESRFPFHDERDFPPPEPFKKKDNAGTVSCR